MKIYINGFMASGKTTVGRELAELLDLEFFDLDRFIESETGQPIPSLISSDEAHFRQIETECLEKLNRQSPESCVIALGGGTACSAHNSQLLLRSGLLIYLERTEEELLQSLPYLMENRPLFKGMSTSEAKITLHRLFEERVPYYRLSQLEMRVNTGFSTKKLANILKLLTNRPQSL